MPKFRKKPVVIEAVQGEADLQLFLQQRRQA